MQHEQQLSSEGKIEGVFMSLFSSEQTPSGRKIDSIEIREQLG